MSSISTGPSLQEHVSFYQEKHGFLSWLWTKDHKRIGIQYMVAITAFFLFAVAMGVLIRMELFTSNVNAGGALLRDSDFYNRILTIHGVAMIFLLRGVSI